MLNITQTPKQLTNHGFRLIALASLFVALAGLLVSPISASADTFCGPQATLYQCGTAEVTVFDSQSGAPIVDAKVVAYNPASGQSVVLYAASDNGMYAAQLPPGEWKIYISAPGYSDAVVPIMLEPAEIEDVKVPLANTRDFAPAAASE
jgi:hypothetical protein